MDRKRQHCRAVTSFPLMVKGKAWLGIKDPPAGEGQVGHKQHRVGRLHPSFLRRVSVPCEGNRKGRKAYCGLVRMWSSPCRRDGEVEKFLL